MVQQPAGGAYDNLRAFFQALNLTIDILASVDRQGTYSLKFAYLMKLFCDLDGKLPGGGND